MQRIATALAFILSALITAPAMPATAQSPTLPATPAFSAEAVQSLPDGSEQVGRIFKAAGNMRIEIEGPDGRTSIQIMRGREGIAYLIDPQSRTYATIRDPSVASAVSGGTDPCPPQAQMQAAQMTCRQVGEGEVSGIVTQTWELTSPQIAAPMRIEWDTGRRQALSQIWPDGTTMTMTFQEMQEMEGRKVEYWSTALQRPGQAPVIGGWWFDPELLVVVREEKPGGTRRALRDIRVGDIDPALFLPPQGYREVQPQAAPAPGSQPGNQ